MESHNPSPLYPTQGSPSSPRVIIAGSYPIRAPPTVDSLLETQDNASNSSSTASSGDESGGFVSGEDDFETASERPFVPDPDEENLESGEEIDEKLESEGDIDEGVVLVRNSGDSDVGFKHGGVSMPIAQCSGDDDEVGEEVLSESDDAFSGVVRVRVSGVREGEEGFEGMGENPRLGSEESGLGGVENGFSGVARVRGGEEGFDYRDSKSGGEDVLTESLKVEEGGNPRLGESDLLENKGSELIESNDFGVEEGNGVRGNEDDDNSKLGINPVGGDSVAAKGTGEDVLIERLKTEEGGSLELGESPLLEDKDSGLIESNVGGAEEENGVRGNEDDENSNLGIKPVGGDSVAAKSTGENALIERLKTEEGGSLELGESPLLEDKDSELIESNVGGAEEENGVRGDEDDANSKLGTKAVDGEDEVGMDSVEAKSTGEDVLPEILKANDVPPSQIQDLDLGESSVGETEGKNGVLGSENDQNPSPGLEPVDQNEVRDSVVGVVESDSIGFENGAVETETEKTGLEVSEDLKNSEGVLPENLKTDEGDSKLGESAVVETMDAELINSDFGGGEEVSGVETQDSKLIESNANAVEVENSVLGSECGQDPKMGVEPGDQTYEPKMGSDGVAGVEKIGISSDVTHLDGTVPVLEIQDAKLVKPETGVAVQKTEVSNSGCDLNPETGMDSDAEKKLDSIFSKADSSAGEKEKDAVVDIDKKVEAVRGSEQKYGESETGSGDVDEDLGSKQLILESEPGLPGSDVKADDSILATKVDNANSSSSRDYLQQIDGQIILDSDEEAETDEEGDEKELFDSAALAALLEAASGAPSDGSITITSPETVARIFASERPAGLGSSIPSLKPAAPRPNRPNIFSPSDLAVLGESDNNNMSEEEKKMQEKIQTIRVKFLRLVQRLGHSPEDTVAAQVLYRLGLAEGLRRGRQSSQAFSLDNARKTAFQLEMSGRDDLDFSCNILVLGKSGVGKSATINSIFGEEKTPTNAFRPTTSTVREIIGFVDGVKIRVIDTPGLRPSVMDQTANRRILSSINKFMKKCPPDIVLYVDRLDTQSRDFNDLPLLRSITGTLGSSIWFNAIVALTHAASAPPDGANGSPLSYEVSVAQRSHVVQHSIRQAAGDMRLMNPVALVENHPSCRRNREGHRVLPNGQSWRSQLLMLCYSSKILSEANSLLKLQEPSTGKLFGLRFRSPPLPFLLSSLLQSRSHPKLPTDQGFDNGDSDIDLADLSDSDREEEDEYDQLPPFKPLRRVQIAKLSKEQRKAYFDEYNYRVKLLQKKQWREELKRMQESKKRASEGRGLAGYGDADDEFDQENGSPAAVPVPMPDMILPPTFDGENPVYRYRFLEPTSQFLARPVLDTHGWDHDCGYDGVNLEETLAIAGRFPAAVTVQITKDKKEFNVHLDSSVSAKYGESGSTLAGFDIQTVGKQLAYILRTETKFKNLKKNKTVGGVTVTFLGETVATGLKVEDQITIGKCVCLVASTGAVRAQGDTAYGANLEARLREKDYPIGQDQSTLGLSLMRWRGDLAVGANLQSQFSVGQSSKIAVRVGLNNKLSGQITVRLSSSEQLQMALVGILPIAVSVFRSIWPGESYFAR